MKLTNKITSKGSSEIKKVKQINKTMLVNGGNLDLYLDLFLTDENGNKEHVLTKKADSLVANFLRILFVQMGGKNDEAFPTGYRYSSEKTITSTSSGAGGAIRVYHDSPDSLMPDTGKAELYGTSDPNIDGVYDYVKVDGYRIDLTGTTYSASTTVGSVRKWASYTGVNAPDEDNFDTPLIEVGYGTTAVGINDFCLAKRIANSSNEGGLTYNSMITAQDTNDATSAQITFTRSFTNNTGATTVVNEIGMRCSFDSAGGSVFIMRDLIPSSLNVSTGKTLTVNYRLKTELDSGLDPGGFTASFMRLLYRQFAQTTRAAFDINNVSRSEDQGHATLKVVGVGGKNYVGSSSNQATINEPGWKQGLVVGTGNTAVSMADYFLETVIEHGITSGKMVYYGGLAENFTIGADYAQFDIVKAIGNESGAPISVNEYALTAGGHDADAGDDSDIPEYLYMISRNVLSASETIEDGEILKLTYSIKVIVTGGASS